MKKSPKVSIIIPLYVIEDRFFEDLNKFSKLDYDDFEILVVCDKKVNLSLPKAKLIVTGKKRTGPAEKRDIAIATAKGSICAFIDDDAYPDRNWLKNAVREFSDKSIAAVGGPGLTPKEDSYWAQLTGLVYGSFFTGGFAQYRFVKGKRQFVKDYPAYNLIVRKRVLVEVGGYGSHFYGGEDTFLCLKIIKRGYKILYDPEIVVYHHRRPLFLPYLKQIGNVGKHRGYFAKKYPETSRTMIYFLPSTLAIGFGIAVIASVFSSLLLWLFVVALSMFIILGMYSMKGKANLVGLFLASIGVVLTHLTYGFQFLVGITSESLDR